MEACWHHARDPELPDNLRLVFLPPHSPELNPVEHVWEYLRENHFGNDTFATLEAVGERLATGLRTLDQQPDLVRSVICFDWLSYPITARDRFWTATNRPVFQVMG